MPPPAGRVERGPGRALPAWLPGSASGSGSASGWPGACANPARSALSSAPLLNLRCGAPPQAVFRPALAQIWVDNLADLYGNINLVTADLLSRCACQGARQGTGKQAQALAGMQTLAAQAPRSPASFHRRAPGSSSCPPAACLRWRRMG